MATSISCFTSLQLHPCKGSDRATTFHVPQTLDRTPTRTTLKAIVLPSNGVVPCEGALLDDTVITFAGSNT